MLEAIKLEHIIQDLQSKYKDKRKTFAILLVKPNGSIVSDEILNNISYFHHRSGDRFDFYLPGYGAYWGSSVPDAREVCEVNTTKWSFSNQKFCELISDLETKSKWKYRGGSELILLDYNNEDIDFSKVVRVRLDAALRDKAIDSVEEFIEKVLGIFLESTDTYAASDVLTLNALGKGIAEELKSKFAVLRIFSRSKHYIINNYSK